MSVRMIAFAGYADRAQRGLAERRAESAAAVDEVAVEDVRERMDAVHVRHHAERGLRFARGDDLLDLVVGERPDGLRTAAAACEKMSYEYESVGCFSVP
jgi:hypothetical protein